VAQATPLQRLVGRTLVRPGASPTSQLQAAWPALVYRSLTTRTQTLAAALLQATSLSILIVAGQIGVQLDLLRPAVYAALVAAGLLSVVLFPVTALTLLRSAEQGPSDVLEEAE
jgi:predicted Kef-type K+ transport protein